MPLGSPLKVSIHSWEAPIASPDTVTLAQQADWIWFEARVLLDGFCVAYVHRLILRDGATRLMSNSERSGSISKLAGLKSLVGQKHYVSDLPMLITRLVKRYLFL